MCLDQPTADRQPDPDATHMIGVRGPIEPLEQPIHLLGWNGRSLIVDRKEQ